MFLVNVLKIAKPITSLIAGYSSGGVVRNVITATTPADLGKYQAMAVKAGAFFVSGAVGGLVGDRIEKQFDNAIKVVEGVSELDPVDKFNSFAATLSPDDIRAIRGALGIEDDSEEKEQG